MNQKTFFGVMLMALSFCSWAKEEDFKPEIVTWPCNQTDGAIVIDGKIDEDAWKKAFTIDKVYDIHNPGDGGAVEMPKEKLSVKVLYDDKYIYIGAQISDRDIIANPDSPDRSDKSSLFLDGDVFEMFIQPEAKKSVYFEFHVNPLNAVWDTRFTARAGYMKWDTFQWQSGVKSAVTLNGTVNKLDEDKSWTVEIAIPLSDITGLDDKPVVPKKGDKWRVSFCAYDYQIYYDDCDNGSTLKYLSTSKLEKINFHERKYFNFIEFK